MKWIKLINKIGKQPLHIANHEDVKLKLPEGDFYLLKLVYTDNGSHFYFELDKKVEPEICSCYREEYGRTVCYGTKEKDVCSCSGNKQKCSIYM